MVQTDMKRCLSFYLLSFLLFLVGCASLFPQQIPLSFERPKQCQELFDRLEDSIREVGARDASSFPVPGFPYLRTNRFLSALKKNLKSDEERAAWVRWMQQLDLRSRKKEIDNLAGKTVLPTMDENPDQEKLFARVESCSSDLLKHDLTRPGFYAVLDPLVDVPDEYSCLRRTIGLYPLFVLPVAVVASRSQNKIQAWFNEDLEDLPVYGHPAAFVPEEEISLRETEIEEILEESKKNTLKISLPDRNQEKKLALAFAPIFIQDVAAPYDCIGRIVWNGNRPEVDIEKPVAYYYFSHAFFKGDPILQINYVIWYAERSGKRSPWIERGHLDGLTVRISLDAQGKPFMVDTEMDCGCYHFFSPDRERVGRVVSKPFQLDPFVPQWLPSIPPGKRVGARLIAGWHQVERLLAVEEPPDPIPYELLPYDLLESLPHEDGRAESIFDAKGIVKGTERVERFILFSMGIPSVGSMRQRSHHAIALIGRSHFDDPYLFDRSFIFK